MATRLGLDRRAVVATALSIVDRQGTAALTMTQLADELGIRLPSLYAHLRGQLDLRRELWLWAVADLGDRLGETVMGRSGEDALFAFATELRHYARRHPGRYQLTLDPPVPFDEEAAAVRRRANAPFRAVVRSFGLEGPPAVHAGRALRAAIHGFVALESYDALALEGADDSFRELIELLCRGLQPAAMPAGSAG